MPELAMKHDFLLKSLFALTAFEMAYSSPEHSMHHINTALEYQSQAFARFRDELARPEFDGEAHDALIYCSIMLTILALASSTQPSLRGSMIDNTLVHFELIRGISVVMLKNPECIKTHPLIGKIPDLMTLPRKDYNHRYTTAIHILNALNDARGPAPDLSSTGDEDLSTEARSRSGVYPACKYAIWWLDYLFSTCQAMKFRGFVLSWLPISGDEFVRALKAGDHVALLTLMWWGVLLNPTGYDYWYAEEFGSTLAGEVAEALAGVPDPRYEELIRLADEEVGESRDTSLRRPTSVLETPPSVQPVASHFWEDPTRFKDDGGVGNIPGEVMKYTSRQNDGFYADNEDKRRLRRHLLNGYLVEHEALNDPQRVEALAQHFGNLNPIESSQA